MTVSHFIEEENFGIVKEPINETISIFKNNQSLVISSTLTLTVGIMHVNFSLKKHCKIRTVEDINI